MKPSDNEIEMLAAGFAIQHKNGLIRFAHALLGKYASARAMTFDDWLAKHCDSDDLTAYERELAWDAWNAALSAPQASEAVPVGIINAARYAGFTFLRHADGSYTLQPIVMATAQADKDGGDCAKGGAEVGATSPESRASACGTVVLPPLPKPFDTLYLEGEECPIYGAGQMQAYARAAVSPSVVKQSLTATQTGEKGDSDE
ncbi:hypothetical protein ELS24_10090 [Achromobacter spanius]|uniref:hypothetical protein n=1 Tax=Achromobacter spanius TaxID=217203 RepID=UPI000F8F945A|nr:hypothetical protein [Achromobacter spanius]AZS78761.1 hypothetical protein ELS24_10090 [Achromobacter spanius]